MTDYYISPTGNDLAAGTSSGTAWRTTGRASVTLTGSDTLYIVGTTAETPMFGRFENIPATVIGSWSDTTKQPSQYFHGGRPLSEGDVYPAEYTTTMPGECQSLTGDGFTAHTSAVLNAVKQAYGTNCIELTSGGVVSARNGSLKFGRGAKFRFRFLIRPEAGSVPRFRVFSNGVPTRHYQTGTSYPTTQWGATASYGVFDTAIALDDTWQEVYTPWMDNASTDPSTGIVTADFSGFTVGIYNQSGTGKLYVQQVSTEVESLWIQHNATIWRNPVASINSAADRDIRMVWKNGVPCTRAASFAAIAEGEIFWKNTGSPEDGSLDDARNELYYYPAAGEDVASIDWYVSLVDNYLVKASSAGTYSVRGISIKQPLTSVFATGAGVTLNMRNCSVVNCSEKGFSAVLDSTLNAYDCFATGIKVLNYNSPTPSKTDGFLAESGATINAYRCHSYSQGDEGFQASPNLNGSSATMNLYSCIAGPDLGNVSGSNGSGIACEANTNTSTTCTVNAYNCTVIKESDDPYDAVVMTADQANTLNMRLQNVFIISDSASGEGFRASESGGSSTLTAITNAVAGVTGATTGGNDAASIAVFDAARADLGADYASQLTAGSYLKMPASDSDLNGTGTDPAHVDAEKNLDFWGNAFNPVDWPIGAIQSINTSGAPTGSGSSGIIGRIIR
jgi:hypothetical protein